MVLHIKYSGEMKNLRWYIGGLLCLSTALNFLDRQTLSVLAGSIQRELRLSDVQYSWITSSFLVSYTAMYFVSGRIVDRIGVRKAFLVAVSGWSLVSMLHAVVHNLAQLIGVRFFLGLFESANYPAGVRAIAEWFPVQERALGVGLFSSGAAWGGALAAPLVSLLTFYFGWRAAFSWTGLLGFFWIAAWSTLYRRNREPALQDPGDRATVLKPLPLRTLLKIRQTWGCVAARVLIDPVSYFLNFWIPKYLEQSHHFSLLELGEFAWLPFAGNSLGNLLGGAIPLQLVARGWSVNRARKFTMTVASALAAGFGIALSVAQPSWLAVICVSGLGFGHGLWGNVALPAEVLPEQAVATVSGLGGTLGGIAGIGTQLGIGLLLKQLSFGWLFASCGCFYFVALILTHWMAGEIGIIATISSTEAVVQSRIISNL